MSREQNSLDSRLEDMLTRKRPFRIALWQILMSGVVAFTGIVCFASLAVKGEEWDANSIEKMAYAIAEIPQTAHTLVYNFVNNYNARLAKEQRFPGQAGLKIRSHSGIEGMAIALARYDGDMDRGVVDIVSLDDGSIIHTYKPDADAVNARSKMPESVAHLKRDFGPIRYVPHHPLLNADGSMVFHGMDSPLVKSDACSRIVWMVDGIFHHAIEKDADGGIWTSGTLYPPTVPFVDREYDDDAIFEISPEGRVLYEKSVSEILIEAGLEYIIYSHDEYDSDPIHLNDIQPVLQDGRYWKKGDLFLSLRNPSMILLYRPSANTIVWMKQGP